MCVCVCAREKKREKGLGWGGGIPTMLPFFTARGGIKFSGPRVVMIGIVWVYVAAKDFS